jgi:hypothetical protein
VQTGEEDVDTCGEGENVGGRRFRMGRREVEEEEKEERD